MVLLAFTMDSLPVPVAAMVLLWPWL